MKTSKVLFILKQREHGNYGTWSYSIYGQPLPSGLSVSAGQVQLALNDLGIDSKIVQVVDNNSIDKEVAEYKPTHVIIEAFWVVPEKFDVLRKLHPNVVWIIRNHSKTAFLSHEGGMIGWAIDYINKGLTLGCNSIEATADFRGLAKADRANPHHVVYLPNYYKTYPQDVSFTKLRWYRRLRKHGYYGRGRPILKDNTLNVGCFGAIRPLKNHLNQAIASIEVAHRIGAKLRFWINATRVEGKAESILRSLRALFQRYPQHELVEVDWMEHVGFLELIKNMNVVLQVSNSETFNIVAADAVNQGVPVLVSNEIPWLTTEFEADPNSVPDIARGLHHLYLASVSKWLTADQHYQLRAYAENAKHIWKEYLHDTTFSGNRFVNVLIDNTGPSVRFK